MIRAHLFRGLSASSGWLIIPPCCPFYFLSFSATSLISNFSPLPPHFTYSSIPPSFTLFGDHHFLLLLLFFLVLAAYDFTLLSKLQPPLQSSFISPHPKSFPHPLPSLHHSSCTVLMMLVGINQSL